MIPNSASRLMSPFRARVRRSSGEGCHAMHGILPRPSLPVKDFLQLCATKYDIMFAMWEWVGRMRCGYTWYEKPKDAEESE